MESPPRGARGGDEEFGGALFFGGGGGGLSSVFEARPGVGVVVVVVSLLFLDRVGESDRASEEFRAGKDCGFEISVRFSFLGAFSVAAWDWRMWASFSAS